MEQHSAIQFREQLEVMRVQMHQWVDTRFDAVLNSVNGNPNVYPQYPITTSILKGRKPLALCMPDGREIAVTTWKQVVTAIMKDCSQNKHCRQMLQKMCGKVWGKSRIILDDKPDRLDVPLKIDDQIFMEGKFDTESLIRVMTRRILDEVGYDYSQIWVKCRESKFDEMHLSPLPEDEQE